MSKEYFSYIKEHVETVDKAFDWFKDNIPELVDGVDFIDVHDGSKYSPAEYDAYDRYFYGKERNEEIEKEFNLAWLHHIHNNEHHWQHWVLVNDDPKLGLVALDIPYHRIIEMICDWWTFSWRTENLYEIFDWYDAHKDYMILRNVRVAIGIQMVCGR